MAKRKIGRKKNNKKKQKKNTKPTGRQNKNDQNKVEEQVPNETANQHEIETKIDQQIDEKFAGKVAKNAFVPHEILDNNPNTKQYKHFTDLTPSIVSIVGSLESSRTAIVKFVEKLYGSGVDRIFGQNQKNSDENGGIINEKQHENEYLLPPITLRTSKLRRATFVQVTDCSDRKYDFSKISDMSVIVLLSEDVKMDVEIDEEKEQKILGVDQLEMSNEESSEENMTGDEELPSDDSVGFNKYLESNPKRKVSGKTFIVNKEKLQAKLRFITEYVAMVRAFGSTKLCVYTDIKCKSILSYFKDINLRVFHSYDKLNHTISCLKNKPTYVKCGHSYVVADEAILKDGEFKLRGYLRGKPINQGDEIVQPTTVGCNPKESDQNKKLNEKTTTLSEVVKKTAPRISLLQDPAAIQEEKILERKKVFLHAPGLTNYEEVSGIDKVVRDDVLSEESEEFESSEEEKQEENVSKTEGVSKNEEIEKNSTNLPSDNEESTVSDEDQKIEGKKSFSNSNSTSENDISEEDEEPEDEFEALKSRALAKLAENYEQKLEETSTESAHADDFKDSFVPGDYIELKWTVGQNNFESNSLLTSKQNSFILSVKLTQDNNVNLTSSSLNQDPNFFPNFIKSHDPAILSVGLFRFVGFPIFYKTKEDGRHIFQKRSADRLCYYGWGMKGMPLMVHRQISEKNTEKIAPKISNKSNINQQKRDLSSQALQLSDKSDLKTLINVRYNYSIVGTGQTGNKFEYERTGSDNSTIKISQITKKLNLSGRVLVSKGCVSFISNLFTSRLEAQNFVNSQVKTFSGLRGIIKKVERNGTVRVRFEGPVKRNDSVALNCFVKIEGLGVFYEMNGTYYRNLKEITAEKLTKEKKNDESSDCSDSSSFSDCLDGKEIQKTEKEVNLSRLRNKLPLVKRLELEKVHKVDDFDEYSSLSLKKKIEKQRNMRNEEVENDRKQKEQLKSTEMKEKLRIKKEGIYKKMKRNKRVQL